MYNQYADDIFRYLYVHVHDRMLAEDLTADTFAKAWQSLDKFDFKQPRGWLYSIARNRLTDYWRTHHTVPLAEDFEVEDDRETADVSLDRVFAVQQLEAAMAKLPPDMRSVVHLRFIQGYSARQTSKAMGIGEGNVRIIQYRALKKLRSLLS